MMSFLTCPYEGRWPSIKCIDGECPTCCNKIRPFQIFCRDIHSTCVMWQKWERNAAGKMDPVQKEGKVRDLLQELECDLTPTKGTQFVQHLRTAFWQYSQFKICRTNPEEGEVVMVQDFGENRKASYSAEIKSAHFGKGQVTVHPVVCFFRAHEQIIRHSIIFLSDDIVHDHHAVKEFTQRTIEMLRCKLKISKVTMWSDGAASQYKGRGTFHDLSHMGEFSSQRCYYGSEHGKGEADGETGIMSQALKRATHEGRNFSSAKDMVAYLKEHYGTETSIQTVLNEAFIEETENEIREGTDENAKRQRPKVGDYVKLCCSVNRVQKTYFAVVIELAEGSDINFSVRFLEKSGNHYVFGEVEDIGLIYEGPPDFYSWEVAKDVAIDQRGHYSFKV